jgi:hypothetical protein
MNSLLFLMVFAGLLLILAMRNNKQMRKVIKQHSSKTTLVSQAITMLVIGAQLSELLKVLEHVSLVDVAASLFLLAMLAATKSGTESELG